MAQRRRGPQRARADGEEAMELRELRGRGGKGCVRYVVSRRGGVEAVAEARGGRGGPWSRFLVWRVVRDLFLPEGYPESVEAGYGAYQAWDVVQGLSSYVRANLAYKATLEGLGVGDVEASAMAGALAKIARDASSMAAGLALAYGCSRDFGRRVRQWRLAADVANDFGMTLQMLAPVVGDGAYFVPLACVAACCQCACGVIAGATKASISAHFARGNFAELVSKEGSQETFVNILGLLGGYACLTRLNASPAAVWTSFAALTAVHLAANVLAVRTITFRRLNEPRFAAAYAAYAASGDLSPRAIGDAEPLLPPLLAASGAVVLGAPLAALADRGAGAGAAAAAALADAVDTAPRDAAFLLLDDGRGRVLALLAPDADDADVLEARFCAQRRSDAPAAGLAEARAASRAFLAALDAAGWDTTTHLLDVGTPRVDWTRQPGDAAAPC